MKSLGITILLVDGGIRCYILHQHDKIFLSKDLNWQFYSFFIVHKRLCYLLNKIRSYKTSLSRLNIGSFS